MHKHILAESIVMIGFSTDDSRTTEILREWWRLISQKLDIFLPWSFSHFNSESSVPAKLVAFQMYRKAQTLVKLFTPSAQPFLCNWLSLVAHFLIPEPFRQSPVSLSSCMSLSKTSRWLVFHRNESRGTLWPSPLFIIFREADMYSSESDEKSFRSSPWSKQFICQARDAFPRPCWKSVRDSSVTAANEIWARSFQPT